MSSTTTDACLVINFPWIVQASKKSGFKINLPALVAYLEALLSCRFVVKVVFTSKNPRLADLDPNQLMPHYEAKELRRAGFLIEEFMNHAQDDPSEAGALASDELPIPGAINAAISATIAESAYDQRNLLVLMTGDGDISYALKRLKAKSNAPLVLLAVPTDDDTVSSELVPLAHQIIEISKLNEPIINHISAPGAAINNKAAMPTIAHQVSACSVSQVDAPGSAPDSASEAASEAASASDVQSDSKSSSDSDVDDVAYIGKAHGYLNKVFKKTNDASLPALVQIITKHALFELAKRMKVIFVSEYKREDMVKAVLLRAVELGWLSQRDDPAFGDIIFSWNDDFNQVHASEPAPAITGSKRPTQHQINSQPAAKRNYFDDFKVFVGGLSKGTDQTMLSEAMNRAFGSVSKCWVYHTQSSGHYGIVQFHHLDSARNAVASESRARGFAIDHKVVDIKAIRPNPKLQSDSQRHHNY
jgi:hypothetical protein